MARPIRRGVGSVFIFHVIPTSSGTAIAEKVGITMIGRAVNKHYLLFTGEHRLVKTDAAHA